MKLYLSSYESADFADPREVLNFHKTVFDERNILIVEVDTPLIGQKYGFGGKDLTTFYLANRVNENAFNGLDRFPIDVHVLIPKSSENMNPSTASDLQNIAWACLYDNKEDARNHRLV